MSASRVARAAQEAARMRCNADGCTGDCLGCNRSTEQGDVLYRFMEELRKPTGDGHKKRSRNEKPPWYEDDSHEAAVFSHICKWKRGELVDPDSGAHPLVHSAWRLLAIACRETGNTPAGGTL